MVRWLMSIIGAGLLVFSYLGKRVHPPLPETPESLSVQASMALTQENPYHYVTIDAGVDLDQKIYNTVLHRPVSFLLRRDPHS